MKNFKIALMGLIVFQLFSCVEDDGGSVINNPDEADYAYDSGVFVTNQGSFGSPTATLSYYDTESGTLTNNLYSTVNTGLVIGDVLQSGVVHNDSLYLVVNNSHKVIVSNLDMNHVKTIDEGLENPRYAVGFGNYVYITNWGVAGDESSANPDDYIAVINKNTLEVETTIPVSFGPEKIVEYNGNLYVLHKGGYSQNNKVSVISLASNTVVTEIEVGDVPDSFVLLNNSLYVLSSGKPSWTGDETQASIARINLTSNLVEETIEFEQEEHPSYLSTNGFNFFYLKGGNVMRSAFDLSNQEEIVAGNFYTATIRDSKLYVTDALDFASAGTFKVFEGIEAIPLEVFSQTAGIIPGELIFNN